MQKRIHKKRMEKVARKRFVQKILAKSKKAFGEAVFGAMLNGRIHFPQMFGDTFFEGGGGRANCHRR